MKTLQILCVALIANAGFLFAQQSTTPSKPESKAASSSPAPSAEVEILKKWVGNWDATIESAGRDGKPVTSSAKMTAKLCGRWLISDFDGTFMGGPFIGHEVLGYDPIAKKYVLNWIDSAATSFSTGEGLYNPATKTLTVTVSGRDDATGKTATWRQVDIWKDADHHEWTLRTISAKDTKESVQMTIRYSRKS